MAEKVGLVYHPDYLKHDAGPGHPESPERLLRIIARLESNGVLPQLVRIRPNCDPLPWIKKVHSADYIEHVRAACQRGVLYLDSGDTGICRDSYDVALLAVSGSLAAVDAVMRGEVRRAFCAVRPPGHHAERDQAMGFCLFNNIAIAAKYLQENYHLQRLMIVDWDVHHGNGTQEAFYEDPTVFYFSIHQYPHYPGTGSGVEKGAGDGFGYTVNVPMSAGKGDDDYVKAFTDVLSPLMEDFQPKFIFISAGFDAHQGDPLSGMSLTEEGFAKLTAIVVEWAERFCKGRVVSLLEGGYNLEALARSVEAHIAALQSDPNP